MHTTEGKSPKAWTSWRWVWFCGGTTDCCLDPEVFACLQGWKEEHLSVMDERRIHRVYKFEHQALAALAIATMTANAIFHGEYMGASTAARRQRKAKPDQFEQTTSPPEEGR